MPDYGSFEEFTAQANPVRNSGSSPGPYPYSVSATAFSQRAAASRIDATRLRGHFSSLGPLVRCCATTSQWGRGEATFNSFEIALLLPDALHYLSSILPWRSRGRDYAAIPTALNPNY